jgi:hypothetical protein
VTTVLELWRGEWWRWYLEDGKPVAFVRETPPAPKHFDLSDVESEQTELATR